MFDAEFWVVVAFACFLIVLGYFGAHKTLVGFIDQRRDQIKAELEEARRLKEEAQSLLAQYQRKRREVDAEAAAIVAGAQAEAERLSAEAKAKMEELVARRTKMAQTKIAQAEAQALADVRAAAAEAAAEAAEKILRRSVNGEVAENVVAQGIEEVRRKLNWSTPFGRRSHPVDEVDMTTFNEREKGFENQFAHEEAHHG